MRILQRALAALVIGALLLLAWDKFFPNNEKQIRKMLNGLASAATIPAKPTPVGTVFALDRIQSSFLPNVQVNVNVPGERQRTFADRAELMQVIQAAWANVRDLNVQFLDINVLVGSNQETAAANLTLKASQPGQRDFFFQELKMELQKKENKWRISKVETVESLRK